jgi:glycosyltransferase involved in cell wall biosynthesis
MRIIGDLTFLSREHAGQSYLYFRGLFIDMAKGNPGHSFVLLQREKDPPLPARLPNLHIHPVTGQIARWAGDRSWYRFVLPRLLKKMKAGLLFTVDNLYGVQENIPTCLLLAEMLPGEKNTDMRQARTALQKASSVISFSPQNNELLKHPFSIPAEKILHLPIQPGTDLAPLPWEEKELVKDRFTKGLEYFIFAGDLHGRHQLLELLKAFSIFKKWQRTNMQLVITGSSTADTPAFLHKTETYKYRSDLVILADPSEETLHSLIGSAYAFVYPALHDPLPVNISKAMLMNIPVITSSIPQITALYNQSVLYASPADATGFSACMQTLFKDEVLRSYYIESAETLNKQAGKADIAALTWKFAKQSLQS